VTNQIQQNRYDGMLRRVGGIIGPGSKVSEVLSELFPVIDVEQVPGELLILAGTRTAHGGSTQGGVAAEAGKYQLFNPVDSGHIITITRIRFSCLVTTLHRWGRSSAVFAGTPVGTEELLDTRNDVTTTPVGQIRRLSVATLSNGSAIHRVLANTISDMHSENGVCVLSPGFGFEAGVNALNTSTECSIQWRERVAEASELEL